MKGNRINQEKSWGTPQHNIIRCCERSLLIKVILPSLCKNITFIRTCWRYYLHAVLYTTGAFLEWLLLIKWSSVVLLLAHITSQPPEVCTSRATFFKCEGARKSYLKDYLMAASSLAELKGQLPEQWSSDADQPLKRGALWGVDQ